MIVGFVGFAGSGKDTAANYLVETRRYVRDSFASSLKDCVSSVFLWPRDMLEGVTEDSRRWREKVDEWWARELGVPHCSPRWVLQHWGTDLLRDRFHPDIWLLSLRRRLELHRVHGLNVVITDVRFPNEMQLIKDLGGVIIGVRGREDPSWFSLAQTAADSSDFNAAAAANTLWSTHRVHASEWSWLASPPELQITNDGTLGHLYEQLEKIVPD